MLDNRRRPSAASVVCLAGGTLQVVYGLLAIAFGPYSRANYGWDELLWAFANVDMIGGVVGLLALDVARPRWIAVTGGALAISGFLIRILTSALLVFRPSADWVALILARIGLMLVGMTSLAIATLLGRQLRGRQAWAPLAVPMFGVVTTVVYSVDQFLHFILLGIWGIPWLLVGYVAFTHASRLNRPATGAIVGDAYSSASVSAASVESAWPAAHSASASCVSPVASRSCRSTTPKGRATVSCEPAARASPPASGGARPLRPDVPWRQ
jgi:hypothetical protein